MTTLACRNVKTDPNRHFNIALTLPNLRSQRRPRGNQLSQSVTYFASAHLRTRPRAKGRHTAMPLTGNTLAGPRPCHCDAQHRHYRGDPLCGAQCAVTFTIAADANTRLAHRGLSSSMNFQRDQFDVFQVGLRNPV